MLSGWLSDRLGERKPLVASGYWTSTLAKAFLAVAASWWFVLLIRFIDRVGKGLRAAPA
jgi:MFS family permease